MPKPRIEGFDQELLTSLQRREPVLWLNDGLKNGAPEAIAGLDPAVAQARFEKYAPVLARLFPELEATRGHLVSELAPIPGLQRGMSATGLNGAGASTPAGAWLLKRDDALPVAGSIKARGGFHEVLTLAQRLVEQCGLPGATDDPLAMAGPEARALLGRHTLSVGSTGNLGLSIGLIGKGLGFQVVVHMSADAKEWKKERLRKKGITVVEHTGDYGAAVEAGRQEAARSSTIHFVDDEKSEHLFLGYSAAAAELAGQLSALGRKVDAAHPLFVYLPCGVGGAPGGIAYGLKRLFGEYVHCFFVEPTASPCMLVQLASADTRRPLSIYDIGLDNVTEADGLAVGQASMLVAPIMADILSGVFTVTDEALLLDTYKLAQAEGILVEPSAASALRGPLWLGGSPQGKRYLARHGLEPSMADATHVMWSTGGSLVPREEHERFQARGAELAA
ncbi:MAG: D-serine ammonia-lyase [Candidimonas sp.]